MTTSLPVVVPAAGLGSRLGPLTEKHAKELLPLGGQPVLHGARLELDAAGIQDVVVVSSPRKPAVGAWASARGYRVVEQPEPRGVFDAVARADLQTDRFVVLFPDFVHLPDQTALRTILERSAELPPEATVYGLLDKTPASATRLGPSAAVQGESRGGVVQIERVGSATTVGPHTCFAELRGTEHSRRLQGGDDGIAALLQGLADDGLLFGVPLPGDVLDVGIPAGYADAVARFEDARAAWRSC